MYKARYWLYNKNKSWMNKFSTCREGLFKKYARRVSDFTSSIDSPTSSTWYQSLYERTSDIEFLQMFQFIWNNQYVDHNKFFTDLTKSSHGVGSSIASLFFCWTLCHFSWYNNDRKPSSAPFRYFFLIAEVYFWHSIIIKVGCFPT